MGSVSAFSFCNVRLYPHVRMAHIQGIGFICTLGVWDACRELCGVPAQILWPYAVEVVYASSRVAFEIKTHGGVSDEGVFVDIDVICTCDDRKILAGLPQDFSREVISAIHKRMAVWEEKEQTSAVIAGPLAPFMDEYYASLRDIGTFVTLRPHDKDMYTFAGIDAWGHAHLLDSEHNETSVAPDTANLYIADSADAHA